MGFAAPAVPYLVAAGGSMLANKIGGRKSTQQVNPNSPQMQGLQNDFATFLQGIISDPAKASGKMGLTSDLQRQSLGGIQQYLNQASPEQQTFEKLSPGLMDLFDQGVDPALSSGLMDIFGLNTAEATGNAAMPLFQQGLQFAQGQLANSGQGRFSTTFENQGIGLSQRALQDFNLLQQQAFTQNIGNRLSAAGLLGNLTNQNVGNRLGAADLLGRLSGQAGQAPFDRLLAAGGLGLQATASNPILQLLLGGMNFAKNAPMDTVVGDSPADAALKGISAYEMMRRPGTSSGAKTWADVWGGR